VNRVLEGLSAECQAFVERQGGGSHPPIVEFFAEARYREQVWEIEVPLQTRCFKTRADLDTLVEKFHRSHEDIFAVRDPGSVVEIVSWIATVKCRLRDHESGSLAAPEGEVSPRGTRQVYFSGTGWVDAEVRRFAALGTGEAVPGPAIIESPFTTIVLDPGATAERRSSGSLSIDPAAGAGGDRASALS
jgi:N-methylhydantoinase A